MQPFVYMAAPARIVFGAGSSERVAEEIRRLGLSQALVLSTPQQKGDAEALAARLGRLAVGVFSDAAMHTPVEVTKNAVEAYRAVTLDDISRVLKKYPLSCTATVAIGPLTELASPN